MAQEARRRRRADRHPVLQPASPARPDRPLHRHREVDDPPRHPLQHPRAVGLHDRARHAAAPGRRRPQHRRRRRTPPPTSRPPSRIIAESPPDFELYSGDDWATFPLVALGAKGVISVAAHLAGERMRDMVELTIAGDASAARKIHDELHAPVPGPVHRVEPHPVEGRAGDGRPARRAAAPAAGPGHRRRARRASGRPWSTRESWTAERSACSPTTMTHRPLPRPRTILASSSSAAWARSAATWPPSRWTAASWSWTRACRSPRRRCRASTWSCPTSSTCASTRTRSRPWCSPTATRTTSARCRTCCASSS